MYEQSEHFNEEIKNLRKCQKEIMELKLTLTALKNSIEKFNNRLDQGEKKSSMKTKIRQ